ncbi:MAG: hypothetical protein HC899_22355 [Leptolyngbyaceae cyanobacterium SM1_4_3]|nr:hypothetical protein [Leptolyngbyaceae cyanobacterium SM1_4_3]
MRLLQIADECFEAIDDALLKELATTLFHSNQCQMLYQQCQSKQDAKSADTQLVSELVEAYQRISKRQSDPMVSRLNALL